MVIGIKGNFSVLWNRSSVKQSSHSARINKNPARWGGGNIGDYVLVQYLVLVSL